MGLGPQVCEQCVVIFDLDHDTGWFCPICGATKSNRYTGISDLKQYEDNLKFLQFMQGKKDGSI